MLYWGKKYLASLDYIDSSNIGILGGSYGGYMTLAALCFHPDEFKTGVDLFGVANWLRTLNRYHLIGNHSGKHCMKK